MEQKFDNSLIMNFNLLGVVCSLSLLGLSIWITDIPLSAKGFWGIGVLMLSLSLVNFVKYRFDERLSADRLQRLEDAKNEKLLEEYVSDVK